MSEGPEIVAVPGIAALSSIAARQIGAGQVLVDPSSVVKELVDNALDARAKSIFVDITANTIDSIQVKDDGHGIPAQDRPLACRRSCTSKIRDFRDLKGIGGKWLGFRGEALSSMAEMSSSLCITTRVEGEPVAVKLKYGRDGELASVEHDSHPIGTTVKVTKFLDFIPVRKQTASKNSANLLAKIRRLMQAYALARPTTRFRLRVLKAKNNNGDFVYAPKADANVKDATLKVIGKNCALQCDWIVLEADGFEVHAFLPKPGATGPKIAHLGAFISIDARPVSSSRGTMKQIVAAYKDRLRKSNPSLAGIKDPFFCLNIVCPPDSYDPNIEPAKDDVTFDNSNMVIGVVDKLLKAYYPEVSQEGRDAEPPTSAQQQYEIQPRQRTTSSTESPIIAHEHTSTSAIEGPPATTTQAQPRWRSSMYGIDEDDLQFLQEDHTPVVEEEEGIRAAEISNPWTIARMNAIVKPKQSSSHEQLLSPAKSQEYVNSYSGSSSPIVTPNRPRSALPLTPQTLSKTNVVRSSLDAELEPSIQHVSQASSGINTLDNIAQERVTGKQRRYEFNISPFHTSMSNHSTQREIHPKDLEIRSSSQSATSSQNMTPLGSSAPCRRHAQQTYANKPFAPPTRGSHDTVLRKPLPGTQSFQPARNQHGTFNQGLRTSATTSSASRKAIPNSVESTIQDQLNSNNDSDIRDFFGCNAKRKPPMNPRHVPEAVLSQASSAEPQPCSKHIRDCLMLDDDRGTDINLGRSIDKYRPSSVGSQILIPLGLSRIAAAEDAHRHDNNVKDMEAYFRSQEKQHVNSLFHAKSASQRQEPRTVPPYEAPSKTHRPRRRTIDALERTKSSKLPLERKPKGFNIQDLILPLPMNILTALQHCRRLDMRRNSLEWGYPAEGAYDSFAEPVLKQRISEWVTKLDALLCERYERIGGADTRREIQEGIQRALDTRKELGDAMPRVVSVGQDTVDGAVGVSDEHVFRGDDKVASSIIQQQTVEPERKADAEFDSDMEQYIDLTANNERQITGTASEGSIEVANSEYDEDVEDEMLMDL
ncbi:hypothetical protein AG0111_0g5060 [Alternaria gaisen]|uniref:Uncharacterized protein n=1 Tax=Alternaria gaisen TaxID=167740 RepID=A0ACB6FQU0_9PLEO|nr:hypothetical protein AG0111_0g5060 [Alternaria gaisen]